MEAVESVCGIAGQTGYIEESRCWKEGSEYTKSDVGVIGEIVRKVLQHKLCSVDADELIDVFAEIENPVTQELRPGGRVWFRILATISGHNKSSSDETDHVGDDEWLPWS